MKTTILTFLILNFALDGLAQLFKPPGTNSTQVVALAWNPPTNTVAGYRLYIGNAPDTYTTVQSLPVGASASVPNLLSSLPWFFRLTATNTLGLESRPSNEVRLAPLDPPSSTRIVSVTVTTETTTTIPAP